MSFERHIFAVSEFCFHNIRDLRRIRILFIKLYYLHYCYLIHLVYIDYCNSLLISIQSASQSSSNCLQLYCSCCHEHVYIHRIRPNLILKSLLWLMIK